MSNSELVVSRPRLGTFQPGPSSSLLSVSSTEDVSSMREIPDPRNSSLQRRTAEIMKLSLAPKPVALVTGFRKESPCHSMYDITSAASLQEENAPPVPPRRHPPPPKYTYASCTSLNALGSRLSWSASSTSAHTTPCAARKEMIASPTPITAVKAPSQMNLSPALQMPIVAPTVRTQAHHKKRPAPPVPVPIRRELQAASLKAIQEETRDIKRKEVLLELRGRYIKMRLGQLPTCESGEATGPGALAKIGTISAEVPVTLSKPIDANSEEALMMELLELLNEKNALLRRQTELMYMKKYHRLEEEQIELDYQIRLLVNKPASQKTSEDEKRESALIHKLVEMVELRNEVVHAQDMDRRRFVKEDEDIKASRVRFMNNVPDPSLLSLDDPKSPNTRRNKEDNNGKKEESEDDKHTHENVNRKSSKKTFKTIFMDKYNTLKHGATSRKRIPSTNVNDKSKTGSLMAYIQREYS